jgi:hypothetical protein
MIMITYEYPAEGSEEREFLDFVVFNYIKVVTAVMLLLLLLLLLLLVLPKVKLKLLLLP